MGEPELVSPDLGDSGTRGEVGVRWWDAISRAELFCGHSHVSDYGIALNRKSSCLLKNIRVLPRDAMRMPSQKTIQL